MTDPRPHKRLIPTPGPGGFPPALGPEPSGRRLRQYFVLAFLTLLVVTATVWGIWQSQQTSRKAQKNEAAADQFCKQLIGLGQPCVPGATDEGGASAAAVIPAAPISPGAYTPVTPDRNLASPDEAGNAAQAFQPGADALIVAVGVEKGVLVLTYSDGARVAAGEVDVAQLSFVLRASPNVKVSASPSPSPSPVAESSAPPTESPSTDAATPEETPS